MMRLDDWSPAAKIAEFPDETKRHDTGLNGLQRFRNRCSILLSYGTMRTAM